MLRFALVGAALLAGACGSRTAGSDASPGDDDAVRPRDADVDVPEAPCTATIGDLGQPMEVRPVFVDYRGQVQPIVDGAVGLIFPPQGGYVIMVGLEAKNVRGCDATITGTVRDPQSGTEIATERRPTQLVAGADGWGHIAFPQSITTANVATCPPSLVPRLPRDFDGNTWRLELELVDDRPVMGRWEGDIVPYCRPDDPDPESCPCDCDSDFVFGQACPVDP